MFLLQPTGQVGLGEASEEGPPASRAQGRSLGEHAHARGVGGTCPPRARHAPVVVAASRHVVLRTSMVALPGANPQWPPRDPSRGVSAGPAGWIGGGRRGADAAAPVVSGDGGVAEAGRDRVVRGPGMCADRAAGGNLAVGPRSGCAHVGVDHGHSRSSIVYSLPNTRIQRCRTHREARDDFATPSSYAHHGTNPQFGWPGQRSLSSNVDKLVGSIPRTASNWAQSAASTDAVATTLAA